MQHHRLLAIILTALLSTAVIGSSSLAAETAVPTRAGQKYLEVQQADGTYSPIYVKGMNLSVALPGHHPSEFPYDEALFREWLKLISEMNCNTVRIYTLLPPEFYRALYYHNTSYPDQQLWLIQGVWAVAPPERDYLNEEYMADLLNDLSTAVEIVHGEAIVYPRPGHAEGIYDKDVSPWLLAWLVGREWEPDDIRGFHELRPDYTTYDGQYISAIEAQPMECWLAQLCDHVTAYEVEHYAVQHPISFSSWPPTDPLSHPSESNLEFVEEMTMDESQGRVDVFSNDAVNLTCKSFSTTPAFTAGIYASYHVYCYYPDFIDNDPAYGAGFDRFGQSNYAAYLEDLKGYYDDRPLIITEYGLSNSLVTAHQQRQGWNHGGLSMEQVAEYMPRLTLAIHDTGCAGSTVFSWIDEWFKKVWLFVEFYDPLSDIPLWFNPLDPEQNFGMIALQPGADGPTCTLSGDEGEWSDAVTYPGESGVKGPRIESVQVQHDEAFLYYRINLAGMDDWDFEQHELVIALDVLDPQRGNFSLPSPLQIKSDSGLEVAVAIHNGSARIVQTESFRFWKPYRVPYSATPRIGGASPYYLEAEDNSHGWVEPVIETNRRRVGRDGTVYPSKVMPLNPLRQGSLKPGRDHDDRAYWNVDPGSSCLELRLPWILAGFVGPHKHRVLQSDSEGRNSSEETTGISTAVVLATWNGEPLSVWPGSNGTEVATSTVQYTWDEWSAADIQYHSQLKPVYYTMQETYGELEGVQH